jgi:hypothetical protein
MAKTKKNLMGAIHKDPIKKTTTQGQGTRSRPKKGKKLLRGQGK